MDWNNMNVGNCMKQLNKFFLFLCLLCSSSLSGQDLKIVPSPVHKPLSRYPYYASRGDFRIQPVEVLHAMPSSFRDTLENSLTRPSLLYPFFERLSRNDVPVRVLHIGDSHVRGHVYTVRVRRLLEQAWGSSAVKPDSISYRTSALAVETGLPGLVYHTMGINGATTAHFVTPDKMNEMAALRPDLVILSFGTNESHGRRYDAYAHRLQLDSMLCALRHHLPGVGVMLTTPPGSYIRQRRRGPRVINKLTSEVVNTLLQFAADNELPVWDMYNIVGGKSRACLNWVGGSYMQRDRIHFTNSGYTLQGELLAEAILKAFNEYVADRLE